MRRSLTPAPLWWGPVLALVVALSTAAPTLDMMQQPYVTWDEASSAWHESLWVAGSLVAGLAALFGALVVGRGSSLHPARVRTGLHQLTVPLLGMWAWATVGLVAGMTPLTWRAWSSATWGGLDGRDVLLAGCGLLLLVSTGLVVGVVVDHWLAGPLAVAIAYVVAALPVVGALRPVALLQAVQQWPASPRFVLSTPTTVFTLNAVLLGSVVALAAAAWALRRDRGSVRLAVASAAGWALLVATAFVWRPDFYTPRLEARLSCDRAPTAVCLHPSHEGSRGTARQLVDRMAVVAPGLATSGRRLRLLAP